MLSGPSRERVSQKEVVRESKNRTLQAWTGSEEGRSSSWGGGRDGSERRREAQDSIEELYGQGRPKFGLLFEHVYLEWESSRLTRVALP